MVGARPGEQEFQVNFLWAATKLNGFKGLRFRGIRGLDLQKVSAAMSPVEGLFCEVSEFGMHVGGANCEAVGPLGLEAQAFLFSAWPENAGTFWPASFGVRPSIPILQLPFLVNNKK